MIAAVEVKVGGQLLDAALAGHLIEVRVEDHLMLPDTFLLRLSDPGVEHVDSGPFTVGAEVEISVGAPEASAPTKILEGQITAVEPEFARTGVVIAARGYDHSHALNRTRGTHSYQNMTAGDIARKVASRAGFDAGTIDDAGGVHDFVQQNNETDWEFLWRLASRLDFEVVVTEKKKLNFRKAGGAGGSSVKLEWGKTLEAFRPRVTGVQQIDEVVVRGWDPKTKDVIESTAKVDGLSSEIGVSRDDVKGALGGGTITVAEVPVMTADEATALAKSVVSHLGNAWVEADGAARGDPRLRAGTKVEISGVGKKFGGTYTLSSTTHVYRSARGYDTQFSISGRAPRTLVELMTPPTRRDWGGNLVIGVVTQNDDPDGMGRVRVNFPSLGKDTESWWARVASPSAGKDRGLLMMPVKGDEVVVAFEHGDVRRPYVLGSLWNGKEQPGDLVQKDGSFVLMSDQKIAITSKEEISVKGAKDLTIERDGKISQKAKGDFTLETQGKLGAKASSDFSAEGQQVSIKGQSSVTIEASGQATIKAASLKIEASGTVQISGSQIMLG